VSDTQLAIRQQSPIAKMIEDRRVEFAKLIGDTVGLERFLRVALTTIGRSPDLQKCSAASLLAGMMDAAQLGLEIGGPLQEGWLIAYGTEAQFQPGYRGFISLLHGHEFIKKIEAHVVYTNDRFSYEYGSDPKITHLPTMGDRGASIGVYSVAWMTNGAQQFEVLSAQDVEEVKRSSRSANASSSPWQKFPGEMWRKSAVKRLIKYLRLKGRGIERVQQALDLDSRDVDFPLAPMAVADVPGADQPGRKMSLKREGKKAEHVEAPPAVDSGHAEQCPAKFGGDMCDCGYEAPPAA
jgi:recombination protein RecT